MYREGVVYWGCCLGGCGEAGEAGGKSRMVQKEARALRAEGVWLGVWGVVDGCVGEVGAAEEGVV